jgi:hypothetical protein
MTDTSVGSSVHLLNRYAVSRTVTITDDGGSTSTTIICVGVDPLPIGRAGYARQWIILCVVCLIHTIRNTVLHRSIDVF